MSDSRKRILITGIAGFIGSHLAKALLKRGDFVIGIDNFNDYYNPDLKRNRVLNIEKVIEGDIQQPQLLGRLLDENAITHLVHLAAQAGVRESSHNPDAYRISNLDGFFCVLEALRKRPHISLIFSSSSSVYGLNKKLPSSENDITDQPSNVYAATKKAGETLAFSYHHLYKIPTIILRYFTVYGPMGRPDMALLKFAHAIQKEQPIELYHQGEMQRDFTYIDDTVDGTIRAIDCGLPFEIFNLARGKPESLLKMVNCLEKNFGKKPQIKMLPMQPGEVVASYADIKKAKGLLGYDPKISLEEGIEKTIDWFKSTFRASDRQIKQPC